MSFFQKDLLLVTLLDKNLTPDITFLVGYDDDNVEKISVASVVLKLRSRVFYTQFSEPWIKNQATKLIEIPDVNPAAFRSFLKYLYTGELTVCKLEDAVGVYYLGVKYLLPDLTEACLVLLKQALEEYNVMAVLDEATIDLYKHFEEIQHACYKVFVKYSEKFINSKEFTCIGIHVLRSVVKLNMIGVDEAQLFSRIYKWALAECERQSIEGSKENIRSVLGTDILYNIRFLSMLYSSEGTNSYANWLWGPNGLYTNEEQLSLLSQETLGLDLTESKRQSMEWCNGDCRTMMAINLWYFIRSLVSPSEEGTNYLADMIWGPNGILINEEQCSLLSRETLGLALAECKRRSMEGTNRSIRTMLGTDVLFNIRGVGKGTSRVAKMIWGPAGILTKEEQLLLLGRQKLGFGAVGNFNTMTREVRAYRAVKRLRAASPLKEWPAHEMSKDRNHCSFRINHTAELVGFGFFGSLSKINANYVISIEIKSHSLSSNVSVSCKRVCLEPGQIMTVFLDKPVQITSKMRPTISYSIQGPPTFAGDGNLKTRVVINNFLKNRKYFIVQFENAPDIYSINQLPVLYFRTCNDSLRK